MSPVPVSRWLVLVLTSALLLVASLEATIAHEVRRITVYSDGARTYRSHYLPNWDHSPLSQPSYQTIDTTTTSNPTPREDSKPKLTATKFIILTTGDQIKLYPLVPGDANGHQGDPELVPTYGHYQVKQRAAGQKVEDDSSRSDDDEDEDSSGGEKSLGDLLKALKSDDKQGGAQKETGSKTSIKDKMMSGRSILPSSSSYDRLSGDPSKTTSKNPWIEDVDYFFDQKFCKHFLDYEDLAHKDCLVIVWLDKVNKLVRYGSLNLAKNPIKIPSSHPSSSSNRFKVLWLRHFAPIQVVDATLSNKGGQVFGMVVDKRRLKVYVAFSDGLKPYANRILSSDFEFDSFSPSSTWLNQGIRQQTIFKFNECKTTPAASSDTDQMSFENLSFDEDNGDWLFYFDQFGGGRIVALNLNKTQTAETEEKDDNQSSGIPARQALVRDIPLGAWSKHGAGEMMMMMNKVTIPNRNATGMAMDSGRRRLYWLDEGNEIHECDYAGYYAKLIGKLSPKPAIRSTHSMQVFRDTLYLSDPIKKSLIAYKITNRGDVNDSLSDHVARQGHYRNGNNSTNYNGQASDDTIRSTHQVLLVEMPTIYGFRLVDIENVGKTTDNRIGGFGSTDGSRSKVRTPHEKDLLNDDHKELETTTTTDLGNRRRPYLEDSASIKPVGPVTTGKTAKLNYSHLLLDRVAFPLQCGYDKSELAKSTKSRNDRLFLFLVELGLFNIAFFVLCCMFCYFRNVAKAKEDKLNADLLISKKCQV